MRDPRFSRRYAAALHREQIQLKAEQLSREIGNIEQIMQATENCLQRILQSHSEENSANRSPDIADAIFSKIEMSELQYKLCQAIRSRLFDYPHSLPVFASPEGLGTYAAQVIAQCLMRVISGSSAIGNNAQQLVEYAAVADDLKCFEEFMLEISVYFQANPESRDEYADVIDKWPTDARLYLDSHRPAMLDVSVDAMLQFEAEIEYPADLWKPFHGNIHLSRNIIFRLSILFALDPSRAIMAIDKFPCFELRRIALWYIHIVEDRDLLVESIKRAPRMFRNDKWISSTTLLMLLAGNIVEHTKQLYAAATSPDWFSHPPNLEELNALTQHEFPAWFKDAFTTLCSRQQKDGINVAIELGIELIRRCQGTASSQYNQDWNADAQALDVLTEILKQHEIDPMTLKATFCSATVAYRDGSRRSALPVLILSIYLVSDGENVSVLAGELWRWYLELLDLSDPGILSDVSPYSQNRLSVRVLGNLLLRVAELPIEGDVVAIWDLAWKSLYPQRQQFRFRHIDYELLEPSLHLLRVGHTCLQYFASGNLSLHGPTIWGRIYKEARCLALGELWSHSAPLQLVREWAKLLAYLPAIFPNEWASELKEISMDLCANHRFTLLSCGYILLNGVSYDELQNALKVVEIDLKSLVSSQQKWLELVGNQHDIDGWPVDDLLGLLRNEKSAKQY